MTRIMVCDACLRASCWHGEFYCGAAKGAGTVLRSVADLRSLGREHESNWAPEKLLAVYGTTTPFPLVPA